MFLSVVTFIIKVQRLILREVSVPVGIVFVPTIVGSQRPRRNPSERIHPGGHKGHKRSIII